MKQFAVVSGKGGTGKTTVTAALACLVENTVIADCDVDAADMHLILSPRIKRREVFAGGKAARIDKEKCDSCGVCRDLCRFGAISEGCIVDPIACEGCGVCRWNCPREAVALEEDRSGEWYVSDTRCGPLVHARLGVAQENSGKLVTIIRTEANKLAEEGGRDYVLIDGPPGIACPVMASLTGADAALVVTEPTLSGLHDFDRIAELLGHFKIRGFVCVNKCDLNPGQASRIKSLCARKGLVYAGEMPFDKAVTRAMIEGKSVLEHSDGPVGREIRAMWGRIEDHLKPGRG
ncbi:MAG: ATP-binding protein [Elusimicrobiota bacterium]